MKKIIKKGTKEFITNCPTCGCEFSYELEDIYMSDKVSCPCCDNTCLHTLESKKLEEKIITCPNCNSKNTSELWGTSYGYKVVSTHHICNDCHKEFDLPY